MNKRKGKRIYLRMDELVFLKFQYVCSFGKQRSVKQQIAWLVQHCVDDYEAKFGEIELKDE